MLITLLLATDQQFVRVRVPSFDALIPVTQFQQLQQQPTVTQNDIHPVVVQDTSNGIQITRSATQPVVVQGRFTDALRNGWHYLQDFYKHMTPEQRQLLQQGFQQATHMAIDLTGKPAQQFINEHGQLVQQIVQNGQIFWKFLQQAQQPGTLPQQLLQQGFQIAQQMAVDGATKQPLEQFVNEHGQLIHQIIQNGQAFWKILQQAQQPTVAQ